MISSLFDDFRCHRYVDHCQFVTSVPVCLLSSRPNLTRPLLPLLTHDSCSLCPRLNSCFLLKLLLLRANGTAIPTSYSSLKPWLIKFLDLPQPILPQPINHYALLSLLRWISWIYSPFSIFCSHHFSPSYFPTARIVCFPCTHSKHCGDFKLFKSDYFSTLLKIFSAPGTNSKSWYLGILEYILSSVTQPSVPLSPSLTSFSLLGLTSVPSALQALSPSVPSNMLLTLPPQTFKSN